MNKSKTNTTSDTKSIEKLNNIINDRFGSVDEFEIWFNRINKFDEIKLDDAFYNMNEYELSTFEKIISIVKNSFLKEITKIRKVDELIFFDGAIVGFEKIKEFLGGNYKVMKEDYEKKKEQTEKLNKKIKEGKIGNKVPTQNIQKGGIGNQRLM